MLIGITGSSGFIGRRLLHLFENTVPIEGDIRDRRGMQKEIKSKKPDVVLNLASKTDVEFCETHKADCEQINLWGALNIVDICSSIGIDTVFMSTFQVFNGNRVLFKSYKEDDTPDPVNYYGMSKLASEQISMSYNNLKIIRAGYVFNRERLNPYIDGIKDMTFPSFQYRSFIHLDQFCYALGSYFDNFASMPKMLHIAGSKTVSWYEFMKDVSNTLHLDISPTVRHFDDDSYIPRPKKAGLDVSLSRKLGIRQYSYKDGLVGLL